jgi:hypothetical protein
MGGSKNLSNPPSGSSSGVNSWKVWSVHGLILGGMEQQALYNAINFHFGPNATPLALTNARPPRFVLKV